MATRLFQAVLGALSCVFLYVIACRFFPVPTPLLTGLMAVGYWPFMLYNGELLATTLTIFIELLLVIQLVRCADRPSYWSVAGAGVLLGLLIETRSNTSVASAGGPLVALPPDSGPITGGFLLGALRSS